jgi:hypothetical protein
MTPKLRFVLSASLLAAGLLTVGACDPGTTAERTQAGAVAEPKPVDLERRIGDDAALPGSNATVTAVEWRRTLTADEKGGFLVVDVAVRNTGTEPAPYSSFDWTLLLPDGMAAVPSVTSLDHLGSGELAPGEGVEGTVVFQLTGPDQDVQVVYQPATAADSRARWHANKPLCRPGAGSDVSVGSCPIASA